MRDVFEFSKLLDLYSLLNVPLCIWMALPSDGWSRPPRGSVGSRRDAAVAGLARRKSAGAWGANGWRWRSQTVRTHRELAPVERRDSASLSSRGPVPGRPNCQAVVVWMKPVTQRDAGIDGGEAVRGSAGLHRYAARCTVSPPDDPAGDRR